MKTAMCYTCTFVDESASTHTKESTPVVAVMLRPDELPHQVDDATTTTSANHFEISIPSEAEILSLSNTVNRAALERARANKASKMN